jgi:O-acetyl-ADP-ribose deacetylase (regulator of RNase III)
MTDVQLILVDPTVALCEAWREFFADLPRVTIVNDQFTTLTAFDCMVSPANSFGLMDGGIDAAIIRFFGDKLMHDVQQYIIDEYLGEQPVGTSFIIGTGHPKHRWLAHTPTMRVPMEIARTDHVYLAMSALLKAVYHHNRRHENKITSIACSGLGTGTGKVPPREAAHQMAIAYRNVLNPPRYISWPYADERQQEIRYGGDFGFNIRPGLR